MGELISETGRTLCLMGKESSHGATGGSTQENMSMTKKKAEASFNGQTGGNTMDSE